MSWHEQNSSFEAMAYYQANSRMAVMAGSTAEYARGSAVTAEFFRVFAAEPAIGRFFNTDEMQADGGAGIGAAAIISDAYWRNRFGGSPDVLGKTIRVSGVTMPVVGVMPPGFAFPYTDIWVPLTRPDTRGNYNYLAIGRLKPGVSLAQAQAEMSAIAGRLGQLYPDDRGRSLLVRKLQDQVVGEVRLTLYLLWGVVAMVLLIACANTATLLLSKAVSRTQEVAVRAALGASQRRIIRQLITESILLALIAGGFGLVLAAWVAAALIALAPGNVPRLSQATIDWWAVAFTLVISMGTSLVFGLIPALQASKVNLIDALKVGGPRSLMSRRMARTRSVLVICEIALAVVLLTGAGLLLKTLLALHNHQLGFEPENVLVMRATGVRSIQENNAFFRELLSPNKPVTMVINTHTHADHTGSNEYFTDNVAFVAHENTKTNMEKMTNFAGEKAKFLPSRTYKDTMTIGSGADQIVLYYFGRAHTSGDSFVVFPALRAMHSGDAFASKGFPLIDVPNGGSAVEYGQTLAKAAATIKNVDTIINGHITTGPTTFSDLKTYADFNNDFLAWVKEQMKANKTVEEAAAAYKIPEKYTGYTAGRGAANNIRIAYTELGK